MTTKKATPVETVSTTEALADDATAEQQDYEPGTPTLLGLLEMPRMRRARAYGALGAVQAQNNRTRLTTNSDDPNGDDEATLAQAQVELDPASFGERYLVVGLIEEFLAVVAADEAEFRAWALTIDDNQLIKTFNIYNRVRQPGEATSSAS